MATYLIGDIQGCYAALKRLLNNLPCKLPDDKIILLGDLVGRGPQALEVLNFLRITPGISAVLGNHDLHLLWVAYQLRQSKEEDKLDLLLKDITLPQCLDWLRQQALCRYQAPYLMVHAGLLPQQTLSHAQWLNSHFQKQLQQENPRAFLESLLKAPQQPHELSTEDLSYLTISSAPSQTQLPSARLMAFSCKVMTHIRTLKTNRTNIIWQYTGHPQQAPKDALPWFFQRPKGAEFPTVVFGHWSALGFYLSEKAICLDTGCVWGKTLTALRLDDLKIWSEPFST